MLLSGREWSVGLHNQAQDAARHLQQVYLRKDSVLSLLWSSMAVLFTLKPTDYRRNAVSLTASPFSRETFHLGLEEGA